MEHCPVLLAEVMEALAVAPGGTYIDCTLGAGGHTEALLEGSKPDGTVWGLDRDEEAVVRCRARLARWGARCRLLHADLGDLAEVAAAEGIQGVAGVVADLGLSSPQLASADRGFSFQLDGPLDMRMDRSRGETAAEFLARVDERELIDTLRRYGEERACGRVARALLRARAQRPITTTGHLAALVSEAKGGRRGRIHPATKTFMAIRIAVNQELESLRRGLDAAIDLVKPGGRVAVISFHSVEDRLVKQRFAAHVGREESLPAGGSRWIGEIPAVRRITRKPIQPGASEIEANPRARSAKLRVVERLH